MSKNKISVKRIPGGGNTAIAILKAPGSAFKVGEADIERNTSSKPKNGQEGDLAKAKHKKAQCMECSNLPEVEVLWAEGMGHAWFCKKCFRKWATEGDGSGEVISVKAIQDGKASKNWKDNKTPNVIKEFSFLKAKQPEGSIDYKVGDTGKAILQLHIMGIEEEKIEALKKVSAEAVKSKSNPAKLRMLLKGAIGEQGCHIDLRMVRKGDKFFSGGEIFTGNLTGLTKLNDLEKGKRLRFAWKAPRVEQPPQVVRGPTSWMDVGKTKIDIFEPGAPGATTKKWGAMLILDSGDFLCGKQDKYLKEFRFSGKMLKGRYLMMYAPIGAKGERMWIIAKPREQHLYAEMEK